MSEIYKNGPVLINFWALWCQPCRAEMKALKEIRIKYSLKGLTILGFNQDTPRSVAKVKAYVSSQGIKYPVILDGNTEIFRKFNGQAMPFSILIDTSGDIVYKHTGYLPGDEKKLMEEIDKLVE
jgi:thiol-disulfide isomerase/thioredoxin